LCPNFLMIFGLLSGCTILAPAALRHSPTSGAVASLCASRPGTERSCEARTCALPVASSAAAKRKPPQGRQPLLGLVKPWTAVAAADERKWASQNNMQGLLQRVVGVRPLPVLATVQPFVAGLHRRIPPRPHRQMSVSAQGESGSNEVGLIALHRVSHANDPNAALAMLPSLEHRG